MTVYSLSAHSVAAPTINPLRGSIRKWCRQFHLLALLVLTVSLATTFQVWRSSVEYERRELQARFEFNVREVAVRIEQRMTAYEQILRSAEGFMSHARSVKRNEFRDFVDKLRLNEKYPGIQGVSYTMIVPAKHKAQHIAAVRREGFPTYSIQPPDERALYVPIIYIEPFSGRNLRAFGLDPYFDDAPRRTVMDQARDLDDQVMTGKVTLIQEDTKNKQPGFVMYQPVYKYGAPRRTVAERRANIVGWVAAPFRMYDLMDGLHGAQTAKLDIEIYDGNDLSAGTLMYDSDHHGIVGGKSETRLFKRTENLKIANHSWTLQVNSLPAFDAEFNRDGPRIIAYCGAGISLLLALLTLALVNGRERAEQVARKMYSELIERETRYRQMFQDITSIAYLLDPDSGRIVDANGAAAMFWGYSMEHLRGMNINEINTASSERLMEAMRQVGEGKENHTEWRHRLKNGEIRDVEVFSSPLAYQGKVLLYSIMHDITARKQAEQALQESKLRLKFALEGAGEGVWDWNLMSNEAHFSPLWKEMLGYAEDEIGSTIDAVKDRIHPDDKSRVLAETRACLKGNTPTYTSEFRMLCKDGSWKWILARGMVISRAGNGRALRVTGTQADIADRKQAERAQVDKIIEAAPDPMLLVASDGMITYANCAAGSTFGYPINELICLSVDDLVPFKSRNSHVQSRQQYENSKTSYSVKRTLTALHRNGTEFPIEISLSRFQMNNQPVVIASIRDISERQRAADLLQQSFAQLRRLADHQQNIKEVERKRIAQDIHDDLGQNLLAIKMDVATLQVRTAEVNPELNERVAVVLDTMLDNVDATIKSVKSIMNDLRPASLELGLYPAIEWQIKQFERFSGIECELATTTPEAAFSLDDAKTIAVFRILQESLANVARHAEATKVEVTLSQDEHCFLMQVSDNGKGLMPGDRGKTDSFGLVGIKERISTLRGELDIVSNPGKGVVLSISIPVQESRIDA
jgi:PAS domain S-box-containing protein